MNTVMLPSFWKTNIDQLDEDKSVNTSTQIIAYRNTS